MKSREVKLSLKSETDPEILKWANSLKYGHFPKIMLEILRWYEKNGLLIKGGVNHPDILPPQIPLNQIQVQDQSNQDCSEILEQLDKLLKVTEENNQLLRANELLSATQENNHLIRSSELLKIASENNQLLRSGDVVRMIVKEEVSKVQVAQQPTSIAPTIQSSLAVESNPVQTSATAHSDLNSNSIVINNEPIALHAEPTDAYTKANESSEPLVNEDVSDVPRMASPFKIFKA